MEKGALRPAWEGLQVLAPLEGEEEMTKAFQLSCQIILEACRNGTGSFL